MQHLKVSGAVRPLKWSLGVKWLMSAPPSARLSAWFSAAATRQISMKFDIVEFHEYPFVKGKGKVHPITGHEGP